MKPISSTHGSHHHQNSINRMTKMVQQQQQQLKASGSYEGDAAVMEPRRSQHIGDDVAQHDGDIWEERLAVVEKAMLTKDVHSPTSSVATSAAAGDNATTTLVIRSYYRNVRTKERVWDEPPTGASRIIHATNESRKATELQLQELQTTLDLIPPDPEAIALQNNNNNNDAKASKKKAGLFSRLRSGGIGGGGGGGFARSSSSSISILTKKKEKKYVERDDSKDLNLQRAIARSLVEQTGGIEEPLIYFDDDGNIRTVSAAKEREFLRTAAAAAAASSNTNSLSLSPSTNQDEEEAIAMAQALSISELNNNNTNMSEEELLQRALEESRLEAERAAAKAGVAAMPTKTPFFGWLEQDDSSSFSLSSQYERSKAAALKSDPNESFTAVMPSVSESSNSSKNLKPPPGPRGGINNDQSNNRKAPPTTAATLSPKAAVSQDVSLSMSRSWSPPPQNYDNYPQPFSRAVSELTAETGPSYFLDHLVVTATSSSTDISFSDVAAMAAADNYSSSNNNSNIQGRSSSLRSPGSKVSPSSYNHPYDNDEDNDLLYMDERKPKSTVSPKSMSSQQQRRSPRFLGAGGAGARSKVLQEQAGVV